MRHTLTGSGSSLTPAGLISRTTAAAIFAAFFAPAAIFAAFFVCAPAQAHMWKRADGTVIDANWIMNGSQSWCCGPKDCTPVGGRVHWTPGGWHVRGWKGSLKTGSAGLFLKGTPDGRPWGCRNVESNELRCLFLNEPHG